MLPESSKDFIYKEKENILTMLKEMVFIESGSHNLRGLKQVSEAVSRELEALGFTLKVYEYEKAGPILVAEKKGDRAESILLLGHTDTVFEEGALEKNPFRLEGGKIFGPGALDMKGGIVQVIFALTYLNAVNWKKYGIKVILVGDEETGHPDSNAREIFEREAKGALCVFCCESGRLNNQIVLERKGVGLLTLQVEGRAAHAGNELASGRNAVVELSRLIVDIDEKYTDPETGLTASVGIVEGGKATNVVPDTARGLFDIRFTSQASFDEFLEYVDKRIQKPHKDQITTHAGHLIEYPPMVKTPASAKLLEYASGQSEKNGFGKLRGISVGGGADSTFFSALGIPTLCAFGPEGEFSHTYEEYVLEESLYERTVLLADCIVNLEDSMLVDARG